MPNMTFFVFLGMQLLAAVATIVDDRVWFSVCWSVSALLLVSTLLAQRALYRAQQRAVDMLMNAPEGATVHEITDAVRRFLEWKDREP